MGLQGQRQSPGKDGGLGDSPPRGRGPCGRGLVAGPASVLGKQASCSLSDTPRQSSYDIYRVPSRQSMEDRGYVHSGKAHRRETPTSGSRPRLGVLVGPSRVPAQLLGRLRPRGSGELPGMPRGSPPCPLWTDLPLPRLQVQPRLAGGPLLQGHQHRDEAGWRQ